MSGNDGLGKEAEKKLKEWLDKPDEGYCFDRIPDQMTGFYGSSNICDFTVYKYPHLYYLESKATWDDRFDFGNISKKQRKGLLEKSLIFGVFGLVVITFATYQRSFIFDIRDILNSCMNNKKSVNILKLEKWAIPFIEIPTKTSRKKLLDYEGTFETLVSSLQDSRKSVNLDTDSLLSYVNIEDKPAKQTKKYVKKSLEIPF